jgi:hypothetical protein
MSVKPQNTPLTASKPQQNPDGHLLTLDCDRWSKPYRAMAVVCERPRFESLLCFLLKPSSSIYLGQIIRHASLLQVFGGTWLWSTHDPKPWYAKLCILCVYTAHIMSPCHVFAIFWYFCHLWQHLKCRSRRWWALSVPRWTVRPSMTCMVSRVSHLHVFSSKKFEVYLMYP